MGSTIGYCEICGKQFVKYRSFHNCCSDLCRQIKTEKNNYGYVKQKEKKKKCKHCGKEFVTNNKKKVYCSEECYVAHQPLQRAIKKETHTCICEVCGDKFETTHHAKKYCCYDCYITAKKIRENNKNV